MHTGPSITCSPDQTLLNQYRIGENKIDVVQVVGIKFEFPLNGDKIIHLETSVTFGKINFSDGLRASAAAKKTLAHRILRENDVVVSLWRKGYVKSFKRDLLPLEFPHLVCKLRIKEILSKILVKARFKFRLGKNVPGIHSLAERTRGEQKTCEDQKRSFHD